MKCRSVLTLATAALALSIGFGIVLASAVSSTMANGRVYTVAEVETGLAHHPKAWLGRTIRVRGSVPTLPIAFTATSASTSQVRTGYAFVASSTDSAPVPMQSSSATASTNAGAVAAPSGALVIEPDPENPILAALRRTPLVGGFIPGPQQLSFFDDRTYHVRLQDAPPSFLLCPTAPCYEAVLLDAAPVQRTSALGFRF